MQQRSASAGTKSEVKRPAASPATVLALSSWCLQHPPCWLPLPDLQLLSVSARSFIPQVASSLDMAWSRSSSVALLCVMALLLVAGVAARAQPQQAQVTGSTTKEVYLRGEVPVVEKGTAVEESLESFERRELSDYGTTSSKPNCSGHCK